MNIRLEHSAVRLNAGESISVIDGTGVRIAADRGRVWITQEHDTRDVVLARGQSFTLDRDGTAIVQAFLDSEVRLDSPVAPNPAPARAPGLTALAVLGQLRRTIARSGGSLPQPA